MSLNRISHDDDNHFGSAKRDTANGIAGLDASKEIINTVPFTVLKEPDKQSFTNLLDNGDFESWSAGAAAAPDKWIHAYDGAGGSVARIADTIIQTYILRLTKSDSGNSHLYQVLPSNYARYKGRVVTFGMWVKSANSAADKIGINISDGTQYTHSYYQNSGNWEFITVTGTISAGATRMWLFCTVNTAATATVDMVGAILVEGSVCPAFSPKPLVDDGKSIDIDSATNKVTFGGLIIYSQTPQILTGAGAIDLTSIITHLVTGGAGADAITLADGIEGQHKTIIMKTITTGGDTSVVTPTHFANGSTITGNSVGDIQNMMFSNGAWHWTGGRGAIIA